MGNVDICIFFLSLSLSPSPLYFYFFFSFSLRRKDVFPCMQCGNGANQIAETVNYVKQNGVQYSTMWYEFYLSFSFYSFPFSYSFRLDIEGTQYWGSTSANQAFFASLVQGANSNGIS